MKKTAGRIEFESAVDRLAKALADSEMPKCPDCGAELEFDYSSESNHWICERCGFETEESDL